MLFAVMGGHTFASVRANNKQGKEYRTAFEFTSAIMQVKADAQHRPMVKTLVLHWRNVVLTLPRFVVCLPTNSVIAISFRDKPD